MRDNEKCIECGQAIPEDARNDRKYCSKSCNNRHYKKIRSGAVGKPVELDPVGRLAKMTAQQLGWVSGIVEGEGSITTTKMVKAGNTYTYALIKVAMTDEDVIRRLHEWTGLGRISGPHRPPSRGDHKPQWAWNVNKHEHVEALVEAMWPLFGDRRRQQVEAMRQRMSERTLKR